MKTEKKRCVIIGGAPIKDYKRAKALLRKAFDFYIYCDCGLSHRAALAAPPNLVVGDFDSYEKPEEKSIDIITLPREKDDTDTMFAARKGVELGFSDFLLLGVLGARADHSLGNIALLLWLHEQEKKAVIADDYSEIGIVSEKPSFVDDDCSFFSLVAAYGKASGVNIKNAKYPLTDAELLPSSPLGVSNEVIPGKRAEISVKNGKLLLIKIKGAPEK